MSDLSIRENLTSQNITVLSIREILTSQNKSDLSIHESLVLHKYLIVYMQTLLLKC